MPIGIIANVGAVAVGGILGSLLKKVLPKRISDALFIVLSFCAMAIGILSTIKLKSLTVVIMAILLGCVAGELCRIETGIGKVTKWTASLFKSNADQELLALGVALTCFSGTGIFGALSEGLDGDSSVLLAKSVLDLFTILIMATQTGMIISVFAIPQGAIYVGLFFLAKVLSSVLTADAIANFKSVGGILTIIIGYNMLAGQCGWKKVRILNLVPAFVFVILLSMLAAVLPFTI